jgi:hypothetical protein
MSGYVKQLFTEKGGNFIWGDRLNQHHPYSIPFESSCARDGKKRILQQVHNGEKQTLMGREQERGVERIFLKK